MHQDKSTRIVYIALVTSRIIIGLGIWYVFFKDAPATGLPGEEIVEDDGGNSGRYYIDQGVVLDGEISKNEEFGQYSHSFVDTKGDAFGLKSADIDLNEYKDSVSIKGVVSDIIDDLPIIKVDEIVSETITDFKNTVEGDKSATYFKDAGLIIDLGPTEGFSLREKGEDIVIIDVNTENEEEVLSISAFDCNSSNSLTDCETLKKNLEAMNAESFRSSKGYTFTNMTETNTWLSFDGNGKGYYLRPSGEKEMTNFVDLLTLVNQGTLRQAIDPLLSKTCKNLDARLGTEYELTYVANSNESIRAMVTGVDTSGEFILSCEYTAPISGVLNFSHGDTSITNNPEYIKPIEEVQEAEPEEIEPEAEPEEEEEVIVEEAVIDVEEDNAEEVAEEANEEGAAEEANEEGEGEGEEIIEEAEVATGDTNTATIIDEGEYAGRLSFSSARGYAMFFSDKGIGYAGSYLSDSDALTVGGSTCTYGVKVTNRKNIDNVQESPDSIIYECAGDVELSALPEGVTYISKLGNMSFLKKDLNGTYVGMEVGIVSK